MVASHLYDGIWVTLMVPGPEGINIGKQAHVQARSHLRRTIMVNRGSLGRGLGARSAPVVLPRVLS